ncbi:hypothetical protein FOMPIDRAFT_1036444 [Fomitopsis schrenkii]|uniref:Pseudouridine synthase I TruA alpha/beta domain-containing protein n=1 Tax=Fomitopsis schrenkii TaxID=2126942 RepID=S8FI97_FOMSC|nr:hypothetical protein FOMPIDRAFT_1036444 [Fomitopsis schrenkii]
MEVQPEAPPSPSASGKRPSETDADPVGAKRVRLDTETDREITPNDHPSEKRQNNDEPKAPRLPKRACALLIGFSGAGYNGMQYQPAIQKVRTIEGTLFDALVKAGGVSKDNADNPTKVGLGRAARTDAGVHAAGNVVSMKLIKDIPGVQDMVARINEELPPEIRLWSILRVSNNFDARTSCDSRKYTYFFPSYLTLPPKPGSGLHQVLQRNGTEFPSHPFWTAHSHLDAESELRQKRAYRMSPDALELLRATASKYLGTHNFHNFTIGREFRDRSSNRHMKEISVADPVVYGNTEWVSINFHGQSFMLHQRKMMTALVLTCRTGTPPQIIDELYGPRVVFTPKMPALGLLLEYPIFDGYNRKAAALSGNLDTSDPNHRPLINFEDHREQMEKFKTEHIYARMREIEEEEAVFDAWIRHIDAYSGDDLLWLNSKGIIPAAAVIQKGALRQNHFRERKRFNATDRSVGASTSVDEEEAEESEEEGLDKGKLNDMEG